MAAPKPAANKVAEKAPAEKKDRKPRVDYGYTKGAIIRVVNKENKYKGQRKSWFDIVLKCDGKTVEAFAEASKGITNGKGTKQPSRGWLRFFVLDKKVTLEAPAEKKAA